MPNTILLDITSRMSSQQHGHITTNGSAAAASTCPGHAKVPSAVARHHEHVVAAGQCCSVVARTMKAPVDAVWSLVRRFDDPQGYKGCIASCNIVEGDGATAGSVRELSLVSGMPGKSSRERLEILDNEQRVISFPHPGRRAQLLQLSLCYYCARGDVAGWAAC